jgi:hypothetical protein
MESPRAEVEPACANAAACAEPRANMELKRFPKFMQSCSFEQWNE